MKLVGQLRVQDIWIGDKADKYGATVRGSDKDQGGTVALNVPVSIVTKLKVDDLLDVDAVVKFSSTKIGLQMVYVGGKCEAVNGHSSGAIPAK